MLQKHKSHPKTQQKQKQIENIDHAKNEKNSNHQR